MTGFMQTLPRPVATYHSKTYDRIAKHHSFDGNGKTVLVTGGASGVGYSIATAFARANVARIIIVSRSIDSQREARAQWESQYPSTQIETHQASITDDARMVEIIQNAGPIDVLILNAAIAHPRVAPTEIDLKEVRQAFEANVFSTFNIVKSYLAMPTTAPKSGSRTIINISSGAAHLVMPHRSAYGASKAAAAHILQSFASSYRDNTVRIFSMHPGSFYTAGVARNMPKSMMEWEDIELPADFALWLAGPESDFLHGRHLWANWDVDELCALSQRVQADPNFLTIGLVQDPPSQQKLELS